MIALLQLEPRVEEGDGVGRLIEAPAVPVREEHPAPRLGRVELREDVEPAVDDQQVALQHRKTLFGGPVGEIEPLVRIGQVGDAVALRHLDALVDLRLPGGVDHQDAVHPREVRADDPAVVDEQADRVRVPARPRVRPGIAAGHDQALARGRRGQGVGLFRQ